MTNQVTDSENPFSMLERWPREQFPHWQTHQARAWIRIGLLLVVPVLLIIAVGWYLNKAIFGDQAVWYWGLLMSLIPALIAFAGILFMSGLFSKAVFGLNTNWNGLRYALLCLFGRPWPLFKYPYILVSNGEIKEDDRDKFLANPHLGGPGQLIVGSNNAVVLERYGKISRIEGPGRVFVDRFERIREIIDLRPQTKTTPATVYTKDGIALKTDITVRFQIKGGTPTLTQPYPFDKEALMTATRSETWRVLPTGKDGRMNWIDKVMGNVESTLRGIVAQRKLDQVFDFTDDDLDPRQEISQAMLSQLKAESEKLGVSMLDVILGPFKADNAKIEEQLRTVWQTDKKAQAGVTRARSKAKALQLRQNAYAQAKLNMMDEIAAEFNRLREMQEGLPSEQQKDLTPYLVALQFTETLRRMAADSGTRNIMPMEAISMLDSLNQRLLGKEQTSPSQTDSSPSTNPNLWESDSGQRRWGRTNR